MLGRLHVPVELVAGTADGVTDLGYLRLLADQLDHVSLTVVEGADHGLPLTDPSGAVATLTRAARLLGPAGSERCGVRAAAGSPSTREDGDRDPVRASSDAWVLVYDGDVGTQSGAGGRITSEGDLNPASHHGQAFRVRSARSTTSIPPALSEVLAARRSAMASHGSLRDQPGGTGGPCTSSGSRRAEPDTDSPVADWFDPFSTNSFRTVRWVVPSSLAS